MANWYICALSSQHIHLAATPIATIVNVPDGHNEDTIIEHFKENKMSAQFGERDDKWANHCVISEQEWNSNAYIGCKRVQPTDNLSVIVWVGEE